MSKSLSTKAILENMNAFNKRHNLNENNIMQDITREELEYKASINDAGIKHDQEKPIMALLPPEALEEEAWVWTFGGKKYGYWNWKKGLVYTRILSAIMRHTVAIMRGEDTDPESGKLHAAHIRCCAGMLIAFHKEGRTDLDDRYKEAK